MILFDLDGTLIDSNGIWVDVDLAFLSQRGLVPTEEYAHTVGHSIFPVAAQFTKDYYHMDMSAREIMDEWLGMAATAYHQVAMKGGAMAFLERCRGAGQPMAMITACAPALCRIALELHGLSHYFEQIIFAEEMGLEKRNPQVFLNTAALLGVAPADCTLYEDAPANCAAAKSVGMTVVGVYDDFYRKYEGEMRGTCDRYIRDFTALMP